MSDTKKVEAPKSVVLTYERLNADSPDGHRCIRDEVADDVMIDTESTFMRRSNNVKLQESDYLTYWEDPNRINVRPNKWRDIRAWKGWSVYKYNEGGSSALLEKWQNRRAISPMDMTRYVHFIGLHSTTGHVDRAGTKMNPDHRNVWKSDTFDGEKLVKKSCLDLDADV